MPQELKMADLVVDHIEKGKNAAGEKDDPVEASENMHRAVLVSSRFSIGQVNLLMAHYDLFESLSWTPCMYLAEGYRPYAGDFEHRQVRFESFDEIAAIEDAFVIIYNASPRDLSLLRHLKTAGIRSYYILHEPFMGLKRIWQEGFNRLVRSIGAYSLNTLLCKMVSTVLLPSEVACSAYEASMGSLNKSTAVFPLSFCKAPMTGGEEDRRYFSFIGTFSDSHGSSEFLAFMDYAFERDDGIRFQIVTRSSLSGRLDQDKVTPLVEQGRLKILEGNPLSTSQMSSAYRSSIVVWCAYTASTQSGVAIDALRNGAPVIATKVGDMSRCIDEGKNGFMVDSSEEFETILNAYRLIHEHVASFSRNSRELFESRFYWGAYRDLAKRIFE